MIRIALAGLGNIGRNVISILHEQQDAFRERYGVELAMAGVVELGGGAIDTEPEVQAEWAIHKSHNAH